MADLRFDERLVPGYWQHETTGVLRPAVEAYLSGAVLTGDQIAAVRAYLRQWIASPGWQGSEVAWLRAEIDNLTTRQRLARWLIRAERVGIDPL